MCAKKSTVTSRLHLNVDPSIPAANQYKLPGSLGKVPDKKSAAAFSIYGRTKPLNDDKSPGPASYNVTDANRYKKSQPVYTMAPRIKDSSVKNLPVPGPGAYNPTLPKKGSTGFTFGTKTNAIPLITAADAVQRR